MELNSPSTKLGRCHKENRYRISLDAFVLSFSTIMLSWFLFCGMDYLNAAVLLVPALVLLTLLSRLLIWQLKSLGFQPWHFVTSKKGMTQYVALVAILVVAAPAYWYLCGIWITHDFMGKFDLETQVLSREFVLLEPVTAFNQPGPFDFRGITTVFAVPDPISEVQNELRNRLQSEPGWQLSMTDYFWGSCDRSQLGWYTTMFLTKDGTLHVSIQYGVPEYCLLK